MILFFIMCMFVGHGWGERIFSETTGEDATSYGSVSRLRRDWKFSLVRVPEDQDEEDV
jgi:hypothetical protein